jgi:hypothetical protein
VRRIDTVVAVVGTDASTSWHLAKVLFAVTLVADEISDAFVVVVAVSLASIKLTLGRRRFWSQMEVIEKESNVSTGFAVRGLPV